MAIATSNARCKLLALSGLVVASTLTLSPRAEALQCPKGYGGYQGRCVPNAQTAKKLYEKQQQDAAAAKRKQAETAEKIKKLNKGKWELKSANTAQPNVPNNKDGKSAEKSKKGEPDKPISFNSGQPNPPSNGGGGSANSAGPNPPKNEGTGKSHAHSANSGKANVPADSKESDGQKPGNKWMTNSSGPNVPGNDDKPGKGKRDRADDDRDDNRKTAKARGADDDDGSSARGKAKARQDDDDAGSSKRKSAKSSADTGSGSRGDKAGDGKPTTTASLGANGNGSGWTHNDSRMSVVNDGKQLTIAYDAPRDGLANLGIKPGTPLFKGTRDGDKVSGEATTFTRKCGTRTYPVSGTLSGGRVELSGDKPLLGGDCNVTGTRREVMVFETGG